MNIPEIKAYLTDKGVNIQDLLKNDIPDEISEYTTAKLIGIIGILAGETFPCSSNSKTSKKLIYNYFIQKYGREKIIFPYQMSFNPNQLQIVNNQINNNNIAIINAGPGTGKSETAVLLCQQLIKKNPNSSILFISYTNKAINEPLTRFKKYNISTSVKKSWPQSSGNDQSTPSTVCHVIMHTIDSLSHIINYSPAISNNIMEINKNDYVFEGFDENIRRAINKIPTYNNFNFTHIIIDEAQDIDDIRIELIFSIAGKFNTPITIFGDPRQRLNSLAGKWFVSLWENKRPHFMNENLFNKLVKFYLNQTYRFKNNNILHIVNNISSIRSNLHVELISNINNNNNNFNKIIDCYLTNNNNEEIYMKILADYLKNIGDKSILVCSISINSDNRTSEYIQRFYTILKSLDIKCYWDISQSDENYKLNGIRFITSSSSKGSEADIVVIVGMTPDKFPHISQDNADSLNFVTFSRAREKIILLAKGYMYTLPRGIHESYINYKTIQPIQGNSDEILYDFSVKYIVTNIAKDRGFDTFMKTNNIKWNSISSNIPLKKIENNKNIDSDIWGIIYHTVMEIFITNKFPKNYTDYLTNTNIMEIDTKLYNDLYNKNLILNGRLTEDINIKDPVNDNIIKIHIPMDTLIYTKNINTPNSDEINIGRNILNKPINKLTYNDILNITIINYWLSNKCMRLRYDLNLGESAENKNEEILNNFKYNSSIISDKFGVCADAEFNIQFCNMLYGRGDLLFNDTIVELKVVNKLTENHIYQLLIYGISLYIRDKKIYKMVLINLTDGEQLTIEFKNLFRFKYCLYKFLKIHTHQNTIISYYKDTGYQYKNKYVVDTEYKDFADKTITEIAVVNLEDPYKSIVSLIKYYDDCEMPGEIQANIQSLLIPKLELLSINNINNNNNNIQDIFDKNQRKFVSGPINWLNSHDSKFIIDKIDFDNSENIEDIKTLFYNNLNIYHPDIKPVLLYYADKTDVQWAGPDAISHDLMTDSKRIAQNNGTFRTVASPGLGIFYRSFGANPIKTLKYLNEHTALSDSLMLFELMKIGVFKQ